MTGVIVRPGESFEKALRRFTKTCEKAGILSDVKKKQRYEKPSEDRKRRLNRRFAGLSRKERKFVNP